MWYSQAESNVPDCSGSVSLILVIIFDCIMKTQQKTRNSISSTSVSIIKECFISNRQDIELSWLTGKFGPSSGANGS